jgi:hypothetical protein
MTPHLAIVGARSPPHGRHAGILLPGSTCFRRSKRGPISIPLCPAAI